VWEAEALSSFLRQVSLCYFRAGYTPDDYPAGPGGGAWRPRAVRSFPLTSVSFIASLRRQYMTSEIHWGGAHEDENGPTLSAQASGRRGSASSGPSP
jgi:hypothetical protein